jgi:hypothetical protein
MHLYLDYPPVLHSVQSRGHNKIKGPEHNASGLFQMKPFVHRNDSLSEPDVEYWIILFD